jgi:hypothetical protein
VLFPNAAGGVPAIRIRPASCIREVQWQTGDYETGIAYVEERSPSKEKQWRAPMTAAPDEPVMLHYAVNRPVGAVRGGPCAHPALAAARFALTGRSGTALCGAYIALWRNRRTATSGSTFVGM